MSDDSYKFNKFNEVQRINCGRPLDSPRQPTDFEVQQAEEIALLNDKIAELETSNKVLDAENGILSSEIETLKDKIAELEKENEDLRDRIDELKNLVRNQSLAINVSEETGAREMAEIRAARFAAGRSLSLPTVKMIVADLINAWKESKAK